MARCSCGREFALVRGLKHHITASGKGHAIWEAPVPASVPVPVPDGPLASRPIPGAAWRGTNPAEVLRIEVVVRVNGHEMTMEQFVSMTNKMATVRDSLKHLGVFK